VTTKNRILEAENAKSVYERNVGDLERKLIENRQRIASAERDIEKLAQARRSSAVSELQSIRAELDEVRQRRSANRELGARSQPWQAGAQDRRNVAFSIIRSSNRSQREFPATETSLIAPGDIVHVRIDKSDGAEAALAR
jgi:chromosome segregation ATPase